MLPEEVVELNEKIPSTSFLDDPDVKQTLDLIKENYDMYGDELTTRELIQSNYSSTFNVSDPTKTPRKTNSITTWQGKTKIKDQLTMPDFVLLNQSVSAEVRALVQSLVEDALINAGLDTILNGDFGVHDLFLLEGDAFWSMAATPNEAFPVHFFLETARNLAFDVSANAIRRSGGQRECRILVNRRFYRWELAFERFPILRGNAKIGGLPAGSTDINEDPNLKPVQREKAKNVMIEVAELIDLNRRKNIMIAGQNAFPFNSLEGNQFPYTELSGDPYLPLYQHICLARQDGMFNWGIGHLLYKIDIIIRILANKGINAAIDHANPLRIVSARTGTEQDFLNQVSKARRDQESGRVGIVWNNSGKDFGGVETLSINILVAELQQTVQLLQELYILNSGVNIKDVATDQSKTLGALELEVEASTKFSRGIQRRNAHTIKFAIERFMDYIVKHVDKHNGADFQLRAKTKVRDQEGKQAEVVGTPIKRNGVIERDRKGKPLTVPFTLGDLQRFLKESKYIVKVKGGVVNNKVLERFHINSELADTPPLSNAWFDLKIAKGEQIGHSFTREDLAPPSPEGGASAVEAPVGEPAAFETPVI